VELLRTLLSRTLGLGGDKPERVLDELSLDGVSRFLRSDRCMGDTGSTGRDTGNGTAGIPDFRSPGTGLYANLQSYDLPYPEAIFEISFFKQNPEPFFALARELYPGQFKPTVCHYFMRLLQDKGLLLRCYTQNIDTLERVAGLDPERLVEAHGTFFTSHCLRPSCRQPYSLSWMKERIFSSLVPKCEKCQGLVKPDIVFFGESLPSRFFTLLQSVSTLGPPPPQRCSKAPQVFWGPPRGDFCISLFPCRDVAWLGDCDTGCLALAELLGWKEELEELVRREHAAIDAQGDDKDQQGPKKQQGDKDPKKHQGNKDQQDPKMHRGDEDKAHRDSEKPQ
ncbi:SIR2 deacetylase, partial [Xiphorhynchus elegans]|nr:SIR2 deacetylase [Xiphorhynchus elegans]